jgi:uncharacterized protein
MSTPTQTAIGRFTWHDLNSTDRERAQRFYSELLGWEVETWKPGEMDYPMISANGTNHGGFMEAQDGAPSHWIGHVAVDDVDAAVERAKSAGGSVLGEPMEIPEIGRIAVIRDPQGAFVSAYESAGEAQIPQGVFIWDELLTSDVEGAKRFYGELFGWTADDADMGGGMTYTLFQIGETSIAGCLKPREGGVPPHWYPYLATNDVDATVAKAKELGADVYMEPTSMEDVGRFAVLGDPTSATFGLMKPE